MFYQNILYDIVASFWNFNGYSTGTYSIHHNLHVTTRHNQTVVYTLSQKQVPKDVLYETIDMTVEFSNNSVSFYKKITGFETFKNYETNIDQPVHKCM